jgi:hypothetical protein
MNVAPPIVIDLGRARPQDVRELLHGAGKLLEELEEVMRLVQLNANRSNDNSDLNNSDLNNSNRHFVPVVAVYRPKRSP